MRRARPVQSTAVPPRNTRCEPAAGCAPPRHQGIASRLSPCRRGSQTPTKLAPHGTEASNPSMCCLRRRREHGSQPRPSHPHPHPRTHTRRAACAGIPTRKRRSDQQRQLPAMHTPACVIGRSRPTPAKRHLPPIGTDRRPFETPAARVVTPERARKRPRTPNRVSRSPDLTGLVRILRSSYVAYLHPQLATCRQ